ncbi:hypothetical protein PIB30_048134 [Stylosanthes scabra]|uniref:Transposase MuDR plant domain-containing protein n=1 Tax=Stylosanthes scabra TaxID=79078 RepID=A0ABU6TI64_9FABA|nr:hypothetical protein [Stylosanthes scabra]
MGVKNYSIRRTAKYKVLESDSMKYYCVCKQSANGCHWRIRVAYRVNVGYWQLSILYPVQLLISRKNNIPKGFLKKTRHSLTRYFGHSQRALRHRSIPGILVISARTQVIRAALTNENGGWNLPQAYHAICVRYLGSNCNAKFATKEGKRLLINAAYSADEKGFNFWFNKLRTRSLLYVEWLDRFS